MGGVALWETSLGALNVCLFPVSNSGLNALDHRIVVHTDLHSGLTRRSSGKCTTGSRLYVSLSGRAVEKHAQLVEHVAAQHDLGSMFITDHENAREPQTAQLKIYCEQSDASRFGRLQAKTVADERSFSYLLYQRNHHRFSAKTLAHALPQYCDIHVVIHDLSVVHGNILAQVLRFQFGVTLQIGLALL